MNANLEDAITSTYGNPFQVCGGGGSPRGRARTPLVRCMQPARVHGQGRPRTFDGELGRHLGDVDAVLLAKVQLHMGEPTGHDV